MLRLVKTLRNGQITIPSEIREELGMDEKTLLQLRLVNQEIRLTPIKISQLSSGSSWLSELYDLFKTSRKKAKKYSSEEINKDIERAIKAVRKK